MTWIYLALVGTVGRVRVYDRHEGVEDYHTPLPYQPGLAPLDPTLEPIIHHHSTQCLVGYNWLLVGQSAVR